MLLLLGELTPETGRLSGAACLPITVATDDRDDEIVDELPHGEKVQAEAEPGITGLLTDFAANGTDEIDEREDQQQDTIRRVESVDDGHALPHRCRRLRLMTRPTNPPQHHEPVACSFEEDNHKGGKAKQRQRTDRRCSIAIADAPKKEGKDADGDEFDRCQGDELVS